LAARVLVVAQLVQDLGEQLIRLGRRVGGVEVVQRVLRPVEVVDRIGMGEQSAGGARRR